MKNKVFFNGLVLFLTAFLDSITTSVESKDCPGSCVHSLATLLCQTVDEGAQCPNNLKCCIETNGTSFEDETQPETQKPTRITTTTKPVTKITQKLEKPTKFDSNKADSKQKYNKIHFVDLK